MKKATSWIVALLFLQTPSLFAHSKHESAEIHSIEQKFFVSLGPAKGDLLGDRSEGSSWVCSVFNSVGKGWRVLAQLPEKQFMLGMTNFRVFPSQFNLGTELLETDSDYLGRNGISYDPEKYFWVSPWNNGGKNHFSILVRGSKDKLYIAVIKPNTVKSVNGKNVSLDQYATRAPYGNYITRYLVCDPENEKNLSELEKAKKPINKFLGKDRFQVCSNYGQNGSNDSEGSLSSVSSISDDEPQACGCVIQ